MIPDCSRGWKQKNKHYNQKHPKKKNFNSDLKDQFDGSATLPPNIHHPVGCLYNAPPPPRSILSSTTSPPGAKTPPLECHPSSNSRLENLAKKGSSSSSNNNNNNNNNNNKRESKNYRFFGGPVDFPRIDISKIATATFPTVSTGLVKPHLTAHLQSVLKDVIFQLLQFNISPTDLLFFAGFQVQMFLNVILHNLFRLF